MIAGRFTRHPRGLADLPAVSVRVSLPRISAFGSADFVIDTGADASVIHEGDAFRILPIGYQPEWEASLRGISTTEVRYAVEPAVLTFVAESGQEVSVPVERLIVAHVGPAQDPLPSLLGRDVLQRFRLVIDPAASLVTLDIQHA